MGLSFSPIQTIALSLLFATKVRERVNNTTRPGFNDSLVLVIFSPLGARNNFVH